MSEAKDEIATATTTETTSCSETSVVTKEANDTISGTTTTTSSDIVINGVKDQPVLNGFHHSHYSNNNNNNSINNNNNNGWKPKMSSITNTTSTTTSYLPTSLHVPSLNANTFAPKCVIAANGPRGHSPKRPNHYNTSPRSRGGSPNNQGVALPPPIPTLSPGQHVVHLHVNPGETISFQLGNEMQLIQGPATVRMVSNNSSPPIPMPVQVPPGHMVQQIVDENGTLRHVILSPQPPMAVPMGPSFGPGPAPNTGPPGSSPFYTFHPAYSHPAVATQYQPHPPNGSLPPQHHMPHQLHGGPSLSHQCNNHHTHQGPSPPPLHPLHKDDRTQRQFIKLKRKLEIRQRENHIVCHTSPPPPLPPAPPSVAPPPPLLPPLLPAAVSSLKKENGVKNYKDRNTSTSGLEDGDHSQEDDEEVRVLTELLSNVYPPQVSQVTAKSAFLIWKSPNMYSENGENKYSEYDVQESEFLYEVLLSDRGKGGKYRILGSVGGLEYMLKNLKPATEYHVCIVALLDDLRGQPSESIAFKTSSCEPDIPLPPRLIGRTKTSLSLKWNGVIENSCRLTTYILESDENSGGSDFVEIYNGIQKQFKVAKLSLSTCYRFRLAAVNEIGKSGYSEVVCYSTSGNPPSQPSPPQLKEAFVNKLHLMWQGRSSDECYILQMEDPTKGLGFVPILNGPETEFVCSRLYRNTEYMFRLCASNEEGLSRWSDVVTYSTLPDRPSAPACPHLTGQATADSLRISWNPPNDDGGSPVTGYVLEMSSGNGEYKEVYNGANMEHECTQLSPGHSYGFRVVCLGAGGKSEVSDVYSVSTLPVCPGQCSAPRLYGKAKAISVHLRWGKPEKDGGSPVIEYEIEMTNPDGSTRLAYKGRETDCVVAGLLPGKMYQFRVRSYNCVGSGSWSAFCELMSAAGPPEAPRQPHVVCNSPHSVTLTWEEPETNGAHILEYRVESSRNDSNFVLAFSGKNLSCDLRGLLPVTGYRFRIQAINSAGVSPHSPDATCVMPASCPSVIPLSAIKCHTTPYSLRVTWHQPNCNGSDIIAYNVDFGESRGVVALGNIREYGIEELRPETPFRIRIQAVNEIGNGPYSSTVKVSTKPLPPLPPKVECAQATYNSLKLKWGDGRCTDYTLYTLEMGSRSGCFTTVYQGTSYFFRVGKLTDSTEYTFRINASNDSGKGPVSEVYRFSTAKAPPTAIKVTDVVNVTENSCVVEWQPVKLAGEDRLLYQLQLLNCRDQRDQEYRVLYKGEETSFAVQGLESKREYVVRVSAVREFRDGTGCIVGPHGPIVTFVTLSKEVVSSGTTRKQAFLRTFTLKPVTEEQWAVVIVCGFILFAVLVAVLIQKIISYSKGTS